LLALLAAQIRLVFSVVFVIEDARTVIVTSARAGCLPPAAHIAAPQACSRLCPGVGEDAARNIRSAAGCLRLGGTAPRRSLTS